MAEQRRGGGQGRPPAKRSGAVRRGGHGSGGRTGRPGAKRPARSRPVTGAVRRGGRGERERRGSRARRPAVDQGERRRRAGRRDERRAAVTGGRLRARTPSTGATRRRRDERRGAEPCRRPPAELGARASARRCGRSASARSATTKPRGTRRGQPSAPTRRRRKRGPADVQQEMAKVAGRNANRALGTLMAAADAFAHDRERETLRILRPAARAAARLARASASSPASRSTGSATTPPRRRSSRPTPT